MADVQHCHACGREVGETIHTRHGVTVQAFALHTGPTEPAVLRRHDDDCADLVYRRLLAPVLIVTCVDCYADPAIRACHSSWAYPVD